MQHPSLEQPGACQPSKRFAPLYQEGGAGPLPQSGQEALAGASAPMQHHADCARNAVASAYADCALVIQVVLLLAKQTPKATFPALLSCGCGCGCGSVCMYVFAPCCALHRCTAELVEDELRALITHAAQRALLRALEDDFCVTLQLHMQVGRQAHTWRRTQARAETLRQLDLCRRALVLPRGVGCHCHS